MLLSSPDYQTIQGYRKKAAILLDGVLNEVLLPQQAINRWPCPKGVDPSVDLAMQALLHFEADEQEQQTDPYYLDAQLQWLEDIRCVLAQGQALSSHMLSAYPHDLATGYYDEHQIVWQPFKAWMYQVGQLWQVARYALRVWLT